MAESRTHIIAQSLIQLAQTLAPEKGEAAPGAARAGAAPADTMASLIRALCPPTADTTRVTDVADLVRALCPANEARSNPAGVARLIQALSPAAEAGGRSRLQDLIAALSPVEPKERIAAITEDFVQGDARKLAEAVQRGAERAGEAGKLTPRQQQAIDVFRVLWPVEKQPQMDAQRAAEFVRALCPVDRPADEVGSLIAALSPADDKTVSTATDAVRFIRALCPAGNVPADDVAQLVRALSPAADANARRTENVAEVVAGLCPAGDARGALIAALSPAVDPASRPDEIAKLLRQVAPDMGPVEVLRTISPAASAD